MKTTRPNKDSTGGGFVNDEITTGGMTDKEQNEIVRKFLKTNIIRKTDEPRNIREVKVGDRIETNERDGLALDHLTMRVVEVLQNCFGYQYFGRTGFYWMTFDELDEELDDGTWKLKRMNFGADRLADAKKPSIEVGVDDSEEVELSDWDLRTLIALVKDNALYYGNSHDALESKLNKMLKEKE